MTKAKAFGDGYQSGYYQAIDDAIDLLRKEHQYYDNELKSDYLEEVLDKIEIKYNYLGALVLEIVKLKEKRND